MRLRSDFHDYYDNAIGYGIDEMVFYSRVSRSVQINVKARANLPTHRQCGLLGFCGEIYPFVEIFRYEWVRSDDGPSTVGKVVEKYFAYSAEDWINKQNEWERFKEFEYRDVAKSLKLFQFFSDWHSQDNKVFLEFGVPAWLFRFHSDGLNGVLNPNLQDLGFHRIKDSTSAFQEISMYLSNILVEQKPILAIEDKYRIEQYGFDLKESFRNTKNRKEE